MLKLSLFLLLLPLGTVVSQSAANAQFPDCNVDVSSIPWFARNLGDGFCAPQLNVPECGYDGGDCDEFNAQYPNCMPLYDMDIFQSMHMYWTTFLNDTECDSYLNLEGCDFDGGDCLAFNEEYPNCQVPFPFFLGDGYCDSFWQGMVNSEACGFDGGDCAVDAEIFSTQVPTEDGTDQLTEDSTSSESSLNETTPYPGLYPNCTIPLPFPDPPHYPELPKIGNGYCDFPLNNADCGFDHGDCDVFNELFPNCLPNKTTTLWMERVLEGLDVEYWWPYWLGDGLCDVELNTPECNFDDGDCVAFNTKYPNCQTDYSIAVGDTYCHCLEIPEAYTEECGWDGGDCVGMEDACEEGMEEATMEPTEDDDDEEEATFAPSTDDPATEQPTDAATTSHYLVVLWITLVPLLMM